LSLTAAYLALGVRHVADGRAAVRDSRIPGIAPAVLQPGWRLAPPGLFRLSVYELAARGQVLGDPQPLRLEATEGSSVLAAIEVGFEIQPADLLAVHRAAAGDLDGWLSDRARDSLKGILARREFSPLSRSLLEKLEQETRRVLGEETRRDGLRLSALRFRSLGYEGAPLIVSGPRTDLLRKVLWLAIDSFDWDIARPLMEEGRMPNLKRLVEEGAWGNLQPVQPLLSPVLWTSAATGKTPDKHGIVDFVAADPASGAVIPVTSTLRRSRAFWNILSDAGVSVGVVAWWASFPAEPVHGFMATDRISYQLFKKQIRDSSSDDPFKTHPRDLFSDIAPLIVRPDQVADREVSRFIDLRRYGRRFSEDDRGRVDEFRTVLASAHTYGAIGLRLFEERPTDLRVIYFEGPDTASHLFMPFVPPPSAGVPEEKVEWFGRVVTEFYAWQDEWIGRFVERFADDDTTILLSSDHGFKHGLDRPATESRISKGRAADWHEREGMLVLAGKDIRRGERILGASILDLVPTLLALYGLPAGKDMDGKVLTAALADEFLERHPPRFIATYETPESSAGSRVARASEDDQELLQKLQSLGYIQQSLPTARINQGTIALQAGDYIRAIREFEAALEGADQDPVRLNLARAYRLNSELEKAQTQLDRLLAKGFGRATVLAEMAAVLAERQDWQGADRRLQEALEADPSSIETHIQVARLAERRRRWDDSLGAYRRVVELDPSAAEAYNQIGFILRVQGKLPEAVRHFEKAIEVNPDLPFPYNNLGLTYRELGQAERARQVLEAGVSMAPRSHILHNSLGSLYYDMGDAARAQRSFERALELAPDYAEAVYNLALLAQEQGRLGAAGGLYRRLLELEPDNPEAPLALSLILMQQKQEARAIPLLAGLIEKDPRNFRGLATLGKIQLNRGRTQEAVALLERAGEVDGTIARLWNDLGRGYAALGRALEARRAFERSLSLDPNQPEISRALARLRG
jgi:tetratricopeptide (TPR) repeat protein